MYPRTIDSTGSIRSRWTSMHRPWRSDAYCRQLSGICATSSVIRWCSHPRPFSARCRSQNVVSWFRILPLPGMVLSMITSNAEMRSVTTTSRRLSSTS